MHSSAIVSAIRCVSLPMLPAMCGAATKNDLIETRLAIGQIAERCGFGDSSNFSRTFKKQNATSPSQFRKKYG